jgi:hypothetical protein
MNTTPSSSEINDELARDLKSFWLDAAVQSALLRSNEFQLYDSTE